MKLKFLNFKFVFTNFPTNCIENILFSMQTHKTHINIIVEYCNASSILDNVDVLCLEHGNVDLCRPVLKTKTAIFFSQKPVLVIKPLHLCVSLALT